jgi:hypothetical protein
MTEDRPKVGIYVPTHDGRVPIRYAHHQVPREILGLINAGYQPVMMESSSCDLIQQRNAWLCWSSCARPRVRP